MGTVSAAALLGGLVDLDVLDNEVGGVEALGVGVGLGVLEEREEELCALDGPAGLGDTKLLAFSGGGRSLSIKVLLDVFFFEAPRAQRCARVCTRATPVGIKGMHPRSWQTYPGRCGQCSRHISSWGQPPCGP